MNKYEAMLIVKPDLPEDQKKAVFSQINEVITKNKGSVTNSSVWADKRRMTFPIKKFQEGLYYLVNFESDPQAIKELNRLYSLNENILRTLITRPIEEK
ncbi:MAG: 30S ribosomal protein S6 [Candidatus Omnitrophota bacterium]|jgi:small subunit ribosomal protein S6|nr:MAG: 30S ribosomal protein S6 [Candidatus Omnitrophota bacterium]